MWLAKIGLVTKDGGVWAMNCQREHLAVAMVDVAQMEYVILQSALRVLRQVAILAIVVETAVIILVTGAPPFVPQKQAINAQDTEYVPSALEWGCVLAI